MIRKPSDTQAVGLHLDGHTLKLVQLDFARGLVKLKRLEEFQLQRSDDGLRFLTEGEDKICQEICDKHLTLASLDGKETLIRKLKIKLLRDKDVEEAFPFEAEGALPYPIEEAVVDKIEVEKDEDSTWLTLLAAKKKSVSDFLSTYQDLKLDPEAVTATPASLAAFASKYAPFEGDLLAVFVGEESSLTSVVRKGKLLSSHSLPTGISSLRKAYEKDVARDPELLPPLLQNFDFGSDDILIAAHLNNALTTLRQELSRMILSEIKGLRLSASVPLLFLGDGALLKGLDQVILTEIPHEKIDVAMPEGTEGMELNQSLLKKFAIAIGTALTGLTNFAGPVNFRQKELSYPEPWKRFKGSLIIFCASALLLSLLIFLCGMAYVGYHEDLLKENYVQTLAQLQKSYPAFEKQYQIQHGAQKGETDPAIMPAKDLTLKDITDRLGILEKEIQAQPDLFPLLPNSPLVTDTLTWLIHHPLMQSPEGAIKIESFSYQLVKRPEMTKKGEKYQVKVDLEITAPTPKMARELHTALISPNDFVDPKAEVKWSANKGKYQTSFFLKDKTIYLPGTK